MAEYTKDSFIPVGVGRVPVTSHFVTQMGGHSGGFLGPSSAVDFCGQICSFMRVYLTLDLSLRLRCPKIQQLRFIWTAHEAGL